MADADRGVIVGENRSVACRVTPGVVVGVGEGRARGVLVRAALAFGVVVIVVKMIWIVADRFGAVAALMGVGALIVNSPQAGRSAITNKSSAIRWRVESGRGVRRDGMLDFAS